MTAITFEPSLEHHLISSVNQSGEAMLLNIPPEMAMEINSKIIESWKSAMDKAFDSIVLLCDARIRSAVRNMIERSLDKLPVLAYDEVVTDTTVEPIETIQLTETSELLSSQQQTVGV